MAIISENMEVSMTIENGSHRIKFVYHGDPSRDGAIEIVVYDGRGGTIEFNRRDLQEIIAGLQKIEAVME